MKICNSRVILKTVYQIIAVRIHVYIHGKHYNYKDKENYKIKSIFILYTSKLTYLIGIGYYNLGPRKT